MSFFRELFGPSREEVWQQLSREIGAAYVDGGLWRGAKVQARVGHWIITLDTYTVSSGKSSTTYTRMRAPFVNWNGLRFTIHRKGFFTPLGKLLGLVQDLSVGDPFFDDAFVVQSNQPERVRELLGNPRVRDLLAAQPAIYLEVRDDEGWFAAQFPDGVDELYFQVVGVITDIARLRQLYELFSEALSDLYGHDPAYQEEGAALLRTLLGPGGRLHDDNVTLWDGDPARREAALRLGKLRLTEAVPALIQALNDRDQALRLNAIGALGEIGDERAAPALIPFLGYMEHPGELHLMSVAAGVALHALSAGELVDAFRQVLDGKLEAVKGLEAGPRGAVVGALTNALYSPHAPFAIHAARAVVELGAVEALPHLCSGARRKAGETVRRTFDEAAEQLTRRQALPHPSEAPVPRQEGLPRPAASPAPSPQRLPRPAE